MKISILFATLNNVEYMKIVVPALRKHTSNPYEILVYANKYSLEMKEYVSNENFDVFEYSHKNEGVAMPINSLARRATGDILFLTADDIYVTPNWDVGLIRKLNDKIFYQYLTACMFEPRWDNPAMNSPFDYGRTPETWREQEFLANWWNQRRIKEDIISGSMPSFIRRELWDKIGGLDEAYWPGFGTDPDLIAKIYFTAIKESQLYEFRGVADSGMYHFQGISTEQIPNNKVYRKDSRRRFEQKWGITVQQLGETIGGGKKL